MIDDVLLREASTSTPVAPSPDGRLLLIDQLLDDVRHTPEKLPDAYAVTAMLESSGFRDADAAQFYGFPDLFALGRALHSSSGVQPLPQRAVEGPLSKPIVPTFLRSYVEGLSFVVPVVIQVATFAAAGYSLWTWDGFTRSQATVVTLALAASLLVTAPMVQALLHRGRHYQYVGNRRLARDAVRQALLLGTGFVVVVAALVGVGATRSEGLRFFLGYFVLLSFLWASIGAAEVAGLRWLVAPATLAGVLILIVLHAVGLTLPVAQWAALALTAGVLIATSNYRLEKAASPGLSELGRARLLPLDALVLQVIAACGYGAAYFAFLFVDHFVNWATAAPADHLLFELSNEYETSIAWALATMFVAGAALEHPSRSFWWQLSHAAARTPLAAYDTLGPKLWRVSLTHTRTVAGVSGLAAAFVVLTVVALQTVGRSAPGAAFAQIVLLDVLVLASVGYALFVVALTAAVVLHALGRTGAVALCLVLASAADLAVGLMATHLWGRDSSVLGLLAGAIVFVVLTNLLLVRTLHRADFFLTLALA